MIRLDRIGVALTFLVERRVRPGQATGTSEVATLIRTAEQISALNTEKAAWAEKKRIDMMNSLQLRSRMIPMTDAAMIAGSVPVF